MFFNEILQKTSLNEFWNAAHKMTSVSDDDNPLYKSCSELQSWMGSESIAIQQRISLRTSSTLVSGAAKIYKQKLDALLEETMDLDRKLIHRYQNEYFSDSTSTFPSNEVQTPDVMRNPEPLNVTFRFVENQRMSDDEDNSDEENDFPQSESRNHYEDDSSNDDMMFEEGSDDDDHHLRSNFQQDENPITANRAILTTSEELEESEPMGDNYGSSRDSRDEIGPFRLLSDETAPHNLVSDESASSGNPGKNTTFSILRNETSPFTPIGNETSYLPLGGETASARSMGNEGVSSTALFGCLTLFHPQSHSPSHVIVGDYDPRVIEELLNS